VVPGKLADYYACIPRRLARRRGGRSVAAQDRLTKARTYAAAGIPEYWIVNLLTVCGGLSRSGRVDRSLPESPRCKPGETLSLAAFPDRPLT